MKKTTLTTLAVSIALGGLAISTAANASPRGGKQMPTFEEMDTNGDGVISADEVAATGKFAESDTNGDGFITLDEMTAQIAERAGNRGMRGPRGNRGGDNAEISEELKTSQMGERMALAAKHIFERMDDNDDGKLAADELPAPKGDKMFENADTDGNGEISQDEWDAAKDGRGHGRRNN